MKEYFSSSSSPSKSSFLKAITLAALHRDDGDCHCYVLLQLLRDYLLTTKAVTAAVLLFMYMNVPSYPFL